MWYIWHCALTSAYKPKNDNLKDQMPQFNSPPLTSPSHWKDDDGILKIRIKVKIADRIYPLTIRPEQEEAIRLSVKKIDQMMKQLEQSYAVRDKQDVLAMCSLQYATKLIQKNNFDDVKNQEDLKKLSNINELIKEHITNFL